MPIPDYETAMLPLLTVLNNGRVYRLRDLTSELADHFRLTAEEREVRLNSGARKFDNKIGWARKYLLEAGLVESAGHGLLVITALGKEVMENPPPFINKNYLMRFPSFLGYIERSKR